MAKRPKLTVIQEIYKDSYSEYYALYEFSSYKFKITCRFRSGEPLGFDTNHCISVLKPDGTWANVADRKEIMPNVGNEYHDLISTKMVKTTAFVDAAIKYIKLIYSE